jgi:hypothetical protein
MNMRYPIFLAVVGVLAGGCVTGSDGNVPADCTAEDIARDGAPADGSGGVRSLLRQVSSSYTEATRALAYAEANCNDRSSHAYTSKMATAVKKNGDARDHKESAWFKWGQISGRCYAPNAKEELRQLLVDWDNKMEALRSSINNPCLLTSND